MAITVTEDNLATYFGAFLSETIGGAQYRVGESPRWTTASNVTVDDSDFPITVNIPFDLSLATDGRLEVTGVALYDNNNRLIIRAMNDIIIDTEGLEDYTYCWVLDFGRFNKIPDAENQYTKA